MRGLNGDIGAFPVKKTDKRVVESDEVEYRVCKECKTEKLLTDFTKDPRGDGYKGYRPICKACSNERRRPAHAGKNGMWTCEKCGSTKYWKEFKQDRDGKYTAVCNACAATADVDYLALSRLMFTRQDKIDAAPKTTGKPIAKITAKGIWERK